MTKPEQPPRNHFYGFSRWSLNDMPTPFFWTDMDMLFPNLNSWDGQTWRELHLVELKYYDSPLKDYQEKLMLRLEQLGVKTHILQLEFPTELYGDKWNLGDPRLATRIILDNKEISLEQLKKQLIIWHGLDLKLLEKNGKPQDRIEEFM